MVSWLGHVRHTLPLLLLPLLGSLIRFATPVVPARARVTFAWPTRWRSLLRPASSPWTGAILLLSAVVAGTAIAAPRMSLDALDLLAFGVGAGTALVTGALVLVQAWRKHRLGRLLLRLPFSAANAWSFAGAVPPAGLAVLLVVRGVGGLASVGLLLLALCAAGCALFVGLGRLEVRERGLAAAGDVFAWRAVHSFQWDRRREGVMRIGAVSAFGDCRIAWRVPENMRLELETLLTRNVGWADWGEA